MKRISPNQQSADATALLITGKQSQAEGIVTLDLASPDGKRLRDWTPGSHIDLMLPNGMTRQYSLCGDRFDPFTYRIGVLREPAGRGGSTYIHDSLSVGDMVGVGGPRNNFPMVPSEEYLFVAGGIGITPLLPMIQQSDLLGATWRLLYAGRRRSTMAFLEELASHGDKVSLMPKNESGLLDIHSFLGDPREGVKIFSCGPARLMTAVESICEDWPPHSLRSERFTAKQFGAPGVGSTFEIELASTRARVQVDPGTSVLDAVASAGVDVLSSCRQGICGTCETTVLEGAPDHRDSLLSDDERATGDCMYICVSRSLTPRLILDL